MPSGMAGAQQRSDPAAAVGDPQSELTGVRKEFGDGRHKVVAVEGADLTVGDGELFAILGPSGSGKTTVLRMVAGFEQPTAGTIRLGGVDVTALPARRRDVNTVFQEYALFPHMTVAQNVEYGLKVKGVARDERRRRTSDALDMVRLSGEASRSPAQLSGGQRQRVALARALVGRPRVLLLDEPLGALDLKLREQMQIELKEIQREVGITFVIVTHDQDEALTLCDRLAVFNNGRIEQIGKARDVYENPANRFVADFVGQGVFLPARVNGAGHLEIELGVLQGNSCAEKNVEVLLRPDDVVHDDAAPTQAEVVHKAFRGAEILYTLRLASGRKVLALVPSHHNHALGERIGIRLDVDHVVAFQPDPSP
jgi:putative spermidine/putrescine transport system ATP-binding protein